MKALGIIPARYKSSRFPGKPLVNILGKPLVIHVAEKAEQALGRENVIIATEDDRIASTVKEFGYRAELTSDAHLTGTDRLWEVAQRNVADIYVNIQGDEPMINPDDINKIVRAKVDHPEFIINGMCDIGSDENPTSVNIPKVLVNNKNELIYMSRLAIPGIKASSNRLPVYKKQVCIYAFTLEELKAYGEASKKAEYEFFEDIEILRFFDLGKRIMMVETSGASLAVDVPEDVEKVEKHLLRERGI